MTVGVKRSAVCLGCDGDSGTSALIDCVGLSRRSNRWTHYGNMKASYLQTAVNATIKYECIFEESWMRDRLITY